MFRGNQEVGSPSTWQKVLLRVIFKAKNYARFCEDVEREGMRKLG